MLKLVGAERVPEGKGMERLRLMTDSGGIICCLHPGTEGDAAVLWVFGAGGGHGGPAGGLYPRLAQRLRSRGVLSLELAWRQPARLTPCVADLLAGVDWLMGQGRLRVALVGHSFGGAVVITAGAAREEVVAVAALSSQTEGTELAVALAPRPLLLMHGLEDEILPATCSRDIHRRAAEPKEIILYPGCGHGLDECRDALDRDLFDWLSRMHGQARARRWRRRDIFRPPGTAGRREALVRMEARVDGTRCRISQANAMTTAKKADKAAAKKGSGQDGTSNAAGTATGPGSSSASAAKRDNQRSIGGTGSGKTNRNRPGHKANG